MPRALNEPFSHKLSGVSTMSHRPAWLSSTPIPIANTRNIEDVITMPFVASPGTLARPHFTSQSLSQTSPGPMRGAPRSFNNPYEPRIIRASSRGSDVSCVSTSPILSPSRFRRPSTSNVPHSPATSPRYPSSSRSVFNLTPVASSSTASFPRPAYLEHSALRHLLHTDTLSILPQHRHKHEPSNLDSSYPASNAFPYLRRERTPLIDSDDEGFISSPRETAPPPALAAGPSNFPLHLPTRWSDHDHNSLLSVSADGRDLSFVGNSSTGEKEAAAGRSDFPIPPACGIYYYEVEILNKGLKGHISIGFSGPDVRLTRLPGWEKMSWGYHGDDGLSFAAERQGSPYGPTYSTGDIIGCGVDFSQNKAFYTKNGALLGLVFDNVGKECVLHASIGLRHQGEAIRANFGQEPFHYDIEDHVHQQRNLTWTKIQKTQLDSDVLQRLNQDDTSSASHDYSIASMTNGDPSTSHLTETLADETDELGDKNKTAVDQLVLSYLTHHGYSKTASALKGQCEASSSSKPPISRHPKPYSDDVDLRTTIVKAVACGDIDSALEGTAVNYPMVLEKELGLMLFKLRCRKFVELLLETAEALKRVKEEEADLENNVSAAPRGHNSFEGDIGLDGMDIDEDAFRPTHTNGFSQPGEDGMLTRRGRRRPSAASTESAQSALDDALSYGQRLEMDYKADVRPEVRAHLKRTFSVVAYEDPLAVGGDIAEIAGQQARDSLATELNQAILESQGKPTRPALEVLYRQTSVCLEELGLLGVGAAVFADCQKEFFDV